MKTQIVLALVFALAACASTPREQNAAAPTLPASILAVADAAREESRFGEALQIYQQILVDNPKSSGAQFGIAECLLGTGKAADARSMFEALTHEPDLRARALAGEGLALLVLNREDDAERRLQQAVSADPSLWRAYNGLGLVADMRRDPEKASAAYFAALALQPASAVILNNLGYSRLLAGRADEALNYLKRALTLDPSSETIQNNVRLALAAGGNYPEATRSVSRALTPVVLNNVGYIALQRGDLVDAEGYLAAAMESSTSFNSIAAKNLEQLRTLKRAAR